MAYLRVDEQATYTDVYCDGFELRFWDTDENWIHVYEDGSSLTKGNGLLWVSSSIYYMSEATSGHEWYIVEDTPVRVVMYCSHIPEASGGPALSGVNYWKTWVTVYPDRYFVHMEFETDGTGFSTGTHTQYNTMPDNRMDGTNQNEYYSTNGSSEQSGTYSSSTEAYYGASKTDDYHMVWVPLGTSISGVSYNSGSGDRYGYSLSNLTFAANTKYKLSSVYIIDHDGREGSAFQYNNSTDRLALGNQYKDLQMQTSPDKGDWTDDLIFPPNIDSQGFAADGAWHLDQTEVKDNPIQITKDRTRIRSSYVIHDRRFIYGSVQNPTDILLNHLKMDDNAANNTLTAEVGPDGSWHAVSDGAARNTSNDSVAADNFRGRALDTQDGTGYGQLAVGAGTVHNNDFLKKGSILFKVTPQFAYNDGSAQYLYELNYDNDNRLSLYYDNGSDYFSAYLEWGNTFNRLDGSAYTDNYSLQRQKVLLHSWDSDKDFHLFALDGQVLTTGVNVGTPTSSHPSKWYIGTEDTRTAAPADIIIDEIKTFSEALLPYGAFFLGNDTYANIDYSKAHADIICFLKGDESNSDSLKLGTGTVTVSGVTYTTDVEDTANGAFVINSALEYIEIDESNINASEGVIGFWYKSLATPDPWTSWLATSNGSSGITAYRNNSATESVLSINSVSATFTNSNFYDQQWHWIVFRYNATNNYREMFVDGISQGIDTTAFTAPGSLGTSLIIGNNNSKDGNEAGNMCNIFFTDKWNTPEIWTAFGKPLHIDLVKKNGVYQQYGA